MENISTLKSILLLFLLFLLHHISIVNSTPRYIAVDNIVLNCGSAGNSTDEDKRMWIGDMEPSKFAPIEEHNQKSNTSEAQNQDSYVENTLYMTARLSYSQFTYVFPVTSGPKFVRLYFYADSYSGFDGSLAFFTVKANSKFTLLRNFSASILANYLGGSTRFSKEFCINVEDDQKLNLTFIPTPSTASSRFFAFVNGIEIVSMPTYLYYSSPENPSPPYVGQNVPFFIDNSRALEMIFRLNLGGTTIQPKNDTGMFREWSQDNIYLLSGGVNPRQPNLMLKYSVIPNYTAPDEVYWSAITMGPNITWNLLSNLTWGLPVDPGFNYLVRLHFCEIEPNITMPGERPFIIYIDNKIAEGTADVIMWSGGRDTPVYQDYVVMIQKTGVDQDNSTLFIALHPGKATNAIYDAILNGVEVFKLSDNNNNLAGPNHAGTLLPSPPSAQQPASTSNSRKTRFIAIGTGVGLFLALLTLACCVVVWKLRTSKRYGSYYPASKCWFWSDRNKRKSTRTKASSLPEELCRQFSLEEIKTATHDFDEGLVIGVGGFGKVYKGFVDVGPMTVAIKRLNPESKQGAQEFWREIEMLSQLRHVHLVSLIGYCNDEREMILVYDYMSNGTLREHLYDTDKDSLPWIQRLEICIGAACGLNYLHTGVKHPIIHRDVKSTNILLDENCVAKVSDFGLSKEGQDDMAVSTMVKGTFGYLDPDYARRRQLTEKSDVYSFGVVLFEVLCARKALNPKLEEEQWNLANWARKCIDKGTMGEIIDPNLMGKIAPECFKVYVDIAESCVRDQGSQRPTMNDVMDKLSFALQRQKEADAAKEKVNPDGKETYTEVLSFHVSDTTETRQCSNIFSGHVSESDSGTWLTTNNTGMTYPSLDSDTVKCEGMFTDNSNVSKA
ncbi:receptor-like protein kinase FERONIA [Juglans microcarpa x Juglans regia]|uniref:receptor-like protein kinase FERONIA n=1 Tax=Juglans microcarpa x Juglans regia TaxID=2249226 RepID=UPI001B7E0790|nr:receptor-like protein kinase FERONIA [Juglans microcarpa x Juglans regia]